MSPTLADLEAAQPFAGRHIGPTDDELAKMLAVVGYGSLEDLAATAVPEAIRMTERLALPPAATEPEVLAELRALGARNTLVTPMIGTGYAGTHTPGVVLRNVLESPAWYTAYTPYQPEISQGRLEMLLNFQTVVGDLTGLDVSGASLLDESTAAAEAMTLARRQSKAPQDAVFVVDSDTHPQTLAVLRTRAIPLGLVLDVRDVSTEGLGDRSVFGALLSYPGSSGRVRDLRGPIALAHETGALVAVATDLLALTLLESPGELGADIAVGSSQRFGVPLGYGGPHAGFLAVRKELARALPGRLVGVSRDAAGAPALRLALQTREQHIRREKATSNICTAQVLLAVVAAAYAVHHGPDGLRTIARRTHRMASALAAALGVEGPFFDTLSVTRDDAADIHARALAGGVELRLQGTTLGISTDETTTRAHLDAVAGAFGLEPQDWDALDVGDTIPQELVRSTSFLTHEVFHSHHSETAMLRYLRRLSDTDLALDRSMIPLGSCTMKLNATTEMEPITWPEFGGLHPFTAPQHAEGYATLIADLERWLAEITGYDAVSLQPNAGSQGELAGLLAIRGYHLSRSESHRDVCLIPASAHGTNAASAVMAGMRVVVVATTPTGDVDVADLRAKVAEHADDLAALMITYPSTHGVYEDTIGDVCAAVHDAGGQVYVDGANLNALVGLARPGRFGADVSHLNLHKTFCIPHGGGGPGVGPTAVRAHLAPFLPGHPALGTEGAVSGAPYGSAGILPISWAYVRLMGAEGLTRATQVAVLSANYVAARLQPHYPVLYTGRGGLVAHECIVDLRPLTKDTGVTVDDVAKRLIDYGFHAPTMSFPVAGTLMIEPTESEDLRELDRFVDAMIAIRGEIDEVTAGTWPLEQSPLRHAPHTSACVVGEWDRPYDRALGAFPGSVTPGTKYWPPVRRIDGAHGDRNLVCSCPSPEELADQR